MTSAASKGAGELKGEIQTLLQKIDELEMDADEHRLVIAALTPLPACRKCWRRIGAVLVEADVGSTLPVLQSNLEGIEKTLKNLKEVYSNKSRELDQAVRGTLTVGAN